MSIKRYGFKKIANWIKIKFNTFLITIILLLSAFKTLPAIASNYITLNKLTTIAYYCIVYLILGVNGID